MIKKCIHCKENKSAIEFNYNASCKDRLTPACKDCLRLQRKRRELKNKVTVLEKTCVKCTRLLPSQFYLLNKSCKDGLNGWCKECAKDAVLQNKYGITLDKYKTMLIAQNHSCAICKTKDPMGPTGEFVVDHCHTSGKVRGLLCNHCNTGLGKLGDTVESLEKAISYLKS
jgi:hypothetical protein